MNNADPELLEKYKSALSDAGIEFAMMEKPSWCPWGEEFGAVAAKTVRETPEQLVESYQRLAEQVESRDLRIALYLAYRIDDHPVIRCAYKAA